VARFILHAGTHKTGTTTIQSVLAANRALLARRGVYYPADAGFWGTRATAPGGTAHFAMANAIARYSEDDKKHLKAFFDHLAEAARKYDTVLLSSETFYRHRALDEERPKGAAGHRLVREAFIERFAELAHGLDMEVSLYFRRPDDFAESLYCETMLRTKNANKFRDFLPQKELYFDYRYQIDLFSSRFRTTAYSYEEKAAAGLVESFFRDNGLGEAPDTGERLRRSVPKRAALWMRQAKLDGPPDRPEQMRRWLFALQESSRRLFGARRPSTFWRTVERRDAFLQARLRQTPEIAFPEAPPRLPPFCDWSAERHRAAEAAFVDWQAENRAWIAAREAAKLPPFAP
jgi:hypothetical protein